MPSRWEHNNRPGRKGFPRKTAALIRARDPQCTLRYPGCTLTTTEADHRIPYYLATQLGWTLDQINHPDNGQGVCTSCHRQKTLREATRGRRNKPRPPTKAKKTKKHPGLK